MHQLMRCELLVVYYSLLTTHSRHPANCLYCTTRRTLKLKESCKIISDNFHIIREGVRQWVALLYVFLFPSVKNVNKKGSALLSDSAEIVSPPPTQFPPVSRFTGITLNDKLFILLISTLPNESGNVSTLLKVLL